MAGGRRRGVRASRLKLEAALAGSGLVKKNQAGLADAIADEEGLDAAPKDLVSKLFRELPVDPQTVERAARILGVDAATLYLSGHEDSLRRDDALGAAVEVAVPWYRQRVALLVVAALLLAIIPVLMWQPGAADARCSDGLVGSDLKTAPDRIGIVISRFAGDSDNEAQMLLARSFSKDPRLDGKVDVFTTCRELSVAGAGRYNETLNRQRVAGKRDLGAVNAQMLLWGERHGDRLTVRFTTQGEGDRPVHMVLGSKSLTADEADFTVPMRLGGDRPVPSIVKYSALNLIPAGDGEHAAMRRDILQRFNTSIEWLRDAIAGDRNLLSSAPVSSDPRLYALTGNQLCYRLRLLGDYDGNDALYAEAERTCSDVLQTVSREQSPQEWLSLNLNLASVIARRHLYAADRARQVATLRRALDRMNMVQPALDRSASPDNYSGFFENAAVMHLRLGEILPGDKGIAELKQAIVLGETSRTSLDAERRPNNYAQVLNNLCQTKRELALRTNVVGLLNEAERDCRAATETVTPSDQPYTWALAQDNLAITYAVLAEQRRNAKSLRNALEEFDRAHRVFTRDEYPVDWARVESNIGELSCKLAVAEDDATMLHNALRHVEAAQGMFADHNLNFYTAYTERLGGSIRACSLDTPQRCACSG